MGLFLLLLLLLFLLLFSFAWFLQGLGPCEYKLRKGETPNETPWVETPYAVHNLYIFVLTSYTEQKQICTMETS